MASVDNFTPLPPTLLDTPWIKVNPSWYCDRWTAVRKRTVRPVVFYVPKLSSTSTSTSTSTTNGVDLILHIVRHGEGLHNVAADESIAAGQTSLSAMPYRHGMEVLYPEFVDAPLTARGIDEAKETARACRSVCPQPKYLVVSPLQRATDTGLLCWSHLLPGAEGGLAAFPVVATDLCRESYHSRNVCDLRRNLSVIRPQYPSVDYSHCSPDPPSSPHVGVPFEDVDSVVDRAHEFVSWLAEREGRDGGGGGGGGSPSRSR